METDSISPAWPIVRPLGTKVKVCWYHGQHMWCLPAMPAWSQVRSLAKRSGTGYIPKTALRPALSTPYWASDSPERRS